jgi:hypothetical protein
MAKIIIHPPGTTREEIEKIRLLRNLERTPNERMKLMFELNLLAMKIKGGPLKKPQGKGIILYRRKDNEV